MSAVATLLASAFVFVAIPARAEINIGGNVFGGGKEGKVGTGNQAYSYDATEVIVYEGNLNNIYGGGEEGDTKGHTKVIMRGGNVSGSVFGGARNASVVGSTYVTLDGENAINDLLIGSVFGGNDIAGKVGLNPDDNFAVVGGTNVLSTYKSTNTKKIWVNDLFGGGNGDYDYTSNKVDGQEQNPYAGLSRPDVANATINLAAGCFGRVFGGGNNATVTIETDITLNNSTSALKKLTRNNAGEIVETDVTHQFGSVFGGNNKVAMDIRPTWNLTKGSVNNLYSGGNAGDMTHANGILLSVMSDGMTINNMFGGCRMADVNPDKNTIAEETFFNTAEFDGYTFPAGYPARVLVTAGRINNVYGGNDVSGDVFGGNALEIRSSIINDVYGGGNGSYTYTDNEDLKDDATWGDFYYSIPAGKTSAQALNMNRPNAEAVYLHVTGTQTSPTYIGGSLYCGGNSATLRKVGATDELAGASALMKIGSYVTAKNVFLGSNGADMVAEATLQKYAEASPKDFNTMDLTDSDTFEEYMRGCEVAIRPLVSFDDDYVEYKTGFGSLYCGGNVGSMSADGYFNLDFLQKLVIYQKLVGGCNNANVAASAYNAAHEGGLITENTPIKVQLNVEGVIFDPKVLTYNAENNTYSLTESLEGGLLKGGNIYGGCYQSGYINGGIEINITKDAIAPAVKAAHNEASLAQHRDYVFNTALSAFGGGYGEETEIKGNTIINIEEAADGSGAANILKVYGGGEMGVVNGNTVINQTAGNVGVIYGGGYEGLVKGNTTVNLDGGGVYQAFGGACNANINGYAELLIGVNGTPAVGDELFGGNDFGGKILGAGLHDGYDTDKVKSNTYVLFNSGTVAGNIYGGSYGSYDYTSGEYLTRAQKSGFAFPSFTTAVTNDGTAQKYANSYVDIKTISSADKVTGNIYGGGYGFLNAKCNEALATAGLGENGKQLHVVDMNNTYVLLRSANNTSNVAENILGGGFYSQVVNTLVDAHSGRTNKLFGGTYGTTAADMDPAVSYSCTNTIVNVYNGINYNSMAVFGGGSYAGAGTTNVNLLGGTVGNAYGGSFNEGVCVTTNVNIPAGSTSKTANVFGGGYGGADNLPCDVITSNVTWESETAYTGAIYGSNNDKRATKFSNVTISKPVRVSDGGTLANVFGGGNGENSITGFSNVVMNSGAEVNNIYGGGNNGKVFGYYDDKSGASAYYSVPANVYAHWAFTAAEADAEWTSKNAAGVLPNTNVTLNTGSVANYVYGAGLGANAKVSGNTYVKLNGGTVKDDIYGGGENGDVYTQLATDLGTGGNVPANQDGNIYTFVDAYGGTVHNIFGGCKDGDVGKAGATSAEDLQAETRIKIGTDGGGTYAAGAPAIQYSVYGGGYRGAVIGTSRVHMKSGYVGYTYNSTTSAYDEKLVYDGDEPTKKYLEKNGNVFGAGYGEGATVDHTDVIFYDGLIRNSLYGGGEIAAVGRGVVNSDKTTATIREAGSTKVQMYGGLVTGDVFGGGRGYAIDAYGNTQNGTKYYTDGYTFGKTEVDIYRGTIGTPHSVAEGQGNVFGGGNIGYVYTTDGVKNATDGYYYANGKLTEDCKVVISPVCVVTKAFGDYAVGDYFPTSELNKLASNSTLWRKVGDNNEVSGNLDDLGINIGNAVFAGGNVSAGSDQIYANAKTVFGNATASVTDVFAKDFITIGDDGLGGLYGDGNLTFVDGYRELNITNYGTDYYTLDNALTVAQYEKLTDRERSYFELLYRLKDETDTHTYTYYESLMPHNYTPDGGDEITYKRGQKIAPATYEAMSTDEKANWKSGSHGYNGASRISETDFEQMDPVEAAKWELYGFCTLYAGRMINTIQRADFCGVFGSRIVLRGAQDRVPSIVDYTDYTINRVSELSLNQRAGTDGNTGLSHGNYFGMYGVVNYLGALTSDVSFYDGIRETDNAEAAYAADGKTWAQWKAAHLSDRKRNNGSSPNEVALSSGVWFEILDESTDTAGFDASGNKIKNYGPITGVVELSLLNVTTGEGGGYVYAKNEHGAVHASGQQQVTLTAANDNAVSKKQFVYDAATVSDKMQTSGNFVNSLKRIIDDCFKESGKYYGADASPAHFWYIRGDFYVYDQYISAYTGSAMAYAETVSIPLTITAEAHGKIVLDAIEGNQYAYWTDSQWANLDSKYKSQSVEDAIMVNGKSYVKNQPITAYEFNHLNAQEQSLFIPKTYVCTVAAAGYKKGDVLTPAMYDAIPGEDSANRMYVCTVAYSNIAVGTEINATAYAALTDKQKENYQSQKSCFNITNTVDHDSGFLLTVDWDNPDIWNDYYHSKTGDATVRKSTSPSAAPANYITSPSFKVKSGKTGIYGQQMFEVGDIVSGVIYDYETQLLTDISNCSYLNNTDPRNPDEQAVLAQAYVAKEECTLTTGDKFAKGAAISPAEYAALDASDKVLFGIGYIVTETYQAADGTNYLFGTTITKDEYDNLPEAAHENFSVAYYCTKEGKWGGKLFEEGKNYEAVEYANLYADERANLEYNYDALDVLSEDYIPVTGGNPDMSAYHSPYYELQSLDYTARYEGADKTISKTVDILDRNGNTTTDNVIKNGDVLTNTVYESLVNEQANYTPFIVAGNDDQIEYYIVKTGFQVGDIWYSPGKSIMGIVYDGLSETDQAKVAVIEKSTLPDLPSSDDAKSYYFCSNAYGTVELGTVIEADAYAALTNETKGFDIDGKVPTETATLYVARESDILDLSEDRIVTVSYWYQYVEHDEEAQSYETIRERHIINVHVHFESGVPIVGELYAPGTVLPGHVVGLTQPSVTKGAYEILGGGWEMFTNSADALSHKNGLPYVKNATPMYWYQDGYYVAYYAKSYLGKTYSNPVQFSVANYHDMSDILTSKHSEKTFDAAGNVTGSVIVNDYMYIDDAARAIPDGKRKPKIYIDSAGELDSLSLLFDKTITEAALSHVKDCNNLDILLSKDIDHASAWTSIGTAQDCFSGDVHGNGHTISGLDNSLFDHLCGDVYNLGVTGSFTGAGIAETGDGYIENSWVATTGTPAAGTMAVFGNPSRSNENDENLIQIVNCYYPETNTYATAAADTKNHGVATQKPVSAFVNGEVAYDLNGYYLNKRYYDGVNTSAGNAYKYWTLNADGSRSEQASTSYYPATVENYVESFIYGDKDFIYADRSIPKKDNIRYDDDEVCYYPIWPDDYIIFGQNLTFDVETADHDIHPMAVNKVSSKIEAENTKLLVNGDNSNRVYRAPAYFGNNSMNVAHFNEDAVFAGEYTVPAGLYKATDATYDAFKGMTAIDFTGSGDNSYAYGMSNDGIFNKKVLDYKGLTGFRNSDLTQNLLVYIPSATEVATDPETKTYNAIIGSFPEPELTIGEYQNIGKVKAANITAVNGHLVQLTAGENGGYQAVGNHFLVDKQDFNAPVAYQFADGNRMWYQREPLHFNGDAEAANAVGSWETIILPFTAKLVSAHQKGAVSHFYGSSQVGHEYWLRGFESIDNSNKAIFTRPAAVSGNVYSFENHYLWDTYFSQAERLDENGDQYQQYYSPENNLTFSDYGFLAAGVPYIVAFPGVRFMEFDMSGTFQPEHTAVTIGKIEKQTITYASAPGATIDVTGNESQLITSKSNNGKNYNFQGTFLNKEVAANTGYVLDVDAASTPGSQFVLKTAAFTAEPFRAYFTTAGSSSAAARRDSDTGTRSDVILIGSIEDENIGGDLMLDRNGGLKVYARGKVIIIESSMRTETVATIYNAEGKVIGQVDVQPGSVKRVPVTASGVYMVNRQKVAVTR